MQEYGTNHITNTLTIRCKDIPQIRREQQELIRLELNVLDAIATEHPLLLGYWKAKLDYFDKHSLYMNYK